MCVCVCVCAHGRVCMCMHINTRYRTTLYVCNPPPPHLLHPFHSSFCSSTHNMQNKFFMLWLICKCCSPEDCCRQFRLCLVFQVAELLLFVIDNQTRAVVSLCEMAYLVGESWAYLVLKVRLLISLVNCRINFFFFFFFRGVKIA